MITLASMKLKQEIGQTCNQRPLKYYNQLPMTIDLVSLFWVNARYSKLTWMELM